MYENGIGVPEDIVLAYMSWNLAAAQGNETENAQSNNDRLEQQMTREQIAEGQRLSTEWIEAHSPGGVPRILVDADSCPVKEETYRVAKRYGLHVVLVSAQWLRVPPEPWLKLEVVKDEGQLDAADDRIVDVAEPGDIVVTEDILLAGRCLEEGAQVLSPRGRVFTEASIDEAIATRELMAGLRESGEITGGPAPFGKRDRSNFLQELDAAVNRLRRSVR